jgi:hypothetical protein
LLNLLAVLIMTLHLAAIGAASLMPLVCIWLKRRQVRRQDALAGDIGNRLAAQSIGWLVVGLMLGGVLVAWLWWSGDERFFAAAARVPQRRWWFGVVQIIFSLGCMIVYWRTWDRPVHRFWHPLLAVLAATNLVYHFPPLFSAIASLERQTNAAAGELSYLEFLRLQMQPEVLWRVAHFLLAALAVCGTMLLAEAVRLLKRQAEQNAFRVASWGARIALVAVALDVLAGMALLLALPAAERGRLVGGDWLATSLLAGGVAASLGLLHHLGGIALGETSRAELLRAIGLLALVLLLMVAARQQARQSSAGPSRPAHAASNAWNRVACNQGDHDRWL